MSELVQHQQQMDNEPATEVKYKKALKRLTRLEKVTLVIKLFK